MNKHAKVTNILSPFLIFVVLTASFYMLMPDNVKINVEKTRTVFNVWENEAWVLGATEYVNLFDGSAKMRAKTRYLSNYTYNTTTVLIREANYKDNITTIQKYYFDSSVDDVELIPIKETTECLNCENKILQFEYKIDDDQGTRIVTSPESFKHRMKVEWEDGYDWAKVYNYKVASDKLIIRYRPINSFEIFNVRMFDPLIHNLTNLTISLSTENLTFIGNENITRYLEINKYSNVSSAVMNLSSPIEKIYSEYFNSDSTPQSITSYSNDWYSPYSTGGACKSWNVINETISGDIINSTEVTFCTPGIRYYVTHTIASYNLNKKFAFNTSFWGAYGKLYVLLSDKYLTSGSPLQGNYTGIKLDFSDGNYYLINTNSVGTQVEKASYAVNDTIDSFNGRRDTTIYIDPILQSYDWYLKNGTLISSGTLNFTTNDNYIYFIWELNDGDNKYAWFDDVSLSFESVNIINPYLEIGTLDGSYEWNETGKFYGPSYLDFKSKINTILPDCLCDGCYSNSTTCIIPFTFHSDTEGILKYYNIEIDYVDLHIPPVNLMLDGVDNSRKYEYQSVANLTTNTTEDTILCLDIGYPGYGTEYVCDNGIVQFLLPLIDPSVLTYADGASEYSFMFPYYSWLYRNISIDNNYPIENTSISLSGLQSDNSIIKFDDMSSITKTYSITANEPLTINLTVDSDELFDSASFSISSTASSIENISIDMYNDGDIDYSYSGEIDQYTINDISLNATKLNNGINGTTYYTIPFNIITNKTGELKVQSIVFVKIVASFPYNVELDIGNDGASDAKFKGQISGSNVYSDTNVDGNDVEIYTCNSTECSYEMEFELNEGLTYDTCHMYFQGSGIGTVFTEDFTDNTYMNHTTLDVDNYFKQVEMSGVSGSYNSGEYQSTQLTTLSESINYLTLYSGDSIEDGASITYYLSLDNGSTWTQAVNGSRLYIEAGGTQPAYKFVIQTDATKTANAYVTGIYVSDLGLYAKNLSVEINGETYNNSNTFNTDMGLFRLNLGCQNINSYLSTCGDLTCKVPMDISFIGPGTMTASQFYFGGTLEDISLDKEVINKHQINSKTQKTNVEYENALNLYKLDYDGEDYLGDKEGNLSGYTFETGYNYGGKNVTGKYGTGFNYNSTRYMNTTGTKHYVGVEYYTKFIDDSYGFEHNSDFTVGFWIKSFMNRKVSNTIGIIAVIYKVGFDCNHYTGEVNFCVRGDFIPCAYSTTPVLRLDEWTYVTGVYNSSNNMSRIYINGIEEDSKDTTGSNFDAGSGHFVVGRGVSGDFQSYNGSLDEVRIWSVALTPEQIIEEMNSPRPVNGYGLNNSFSFELYNETNVRDTNHIVTSYPSSEYGATRFDGVDDKVKLPNLGFTKTTPVTMSLWFKSNDDSYNSFDAQPLIQTEYVRLHIRETYNAIQLRYGNVEARIVRYILGEGDREWHHVVGMYDGNTTLTLYVDGDLKSTFTHPVGANSHYDSHIGYWNGGFNGSIADVMLFNKTLTASEVGILYNQTIPYTDYGQSKLGNDTYSYLVFPRYSVANDINLSITGNYWR